MIPAFIFLRFSSDPLPKFSSAVYKVSVTENGLRNRYVTILYAYADTSTLARQSLLFSIASGNEKQNFTINNYYSYYCRIYVRGYMDRETQSSFNLTVKAVNRADTSLTATATVVVTISDVNDNAPKFIQKSYAANVSESAPIGTTVVQISAVDIDAGSNSKLTYSILSGNSQGQFGVDSGTGYVVTAGALDREQQIDYQLFILVQDNPTGSAPLETTADLRITIKDENDNAPLFTQSTYQLTVSEGAVVGTTVIHLTANDLDEGSNAIIAYNISSGNTGSAFSVHSTDGIVTIAKTLDRETVARYQLTLTATDSGMPPKTGIATLVVSVSDINDNEPAFTLSSYTANVVENGAIGQLIVQVSASEKDSGGISVITYSLAAAATTNFKISSSGMITALKSFDRESQALYSFTVYAADSAPSPRTGSATVTVSIDDLNDNPPTFQNLPYVGQVKETIPIGTSVLRVTAADPDDGSNGTVTYSIQNKNSGCVINSQTGVILSDVLLNYVKKSNYSFVVEAADGGSPAQSQTIPVIITVVDVNDHDPIFGSDEYKISVKEDASTSSTLLSLTASDGDAGANARIAYSISGGNVGNKFNIDSATGELYLVASLDYETLDDYALTVTAVDGGSSPRTGVAAVNVAVTDVNDNTPLFAQVVYVASVSTLAPNGTIIASVSASDADSGSNGVLMYTITNGNSKGLFAVDPATGEVTTTKVIGGQSTTYSLKITASDKGSPVKQGQCLLTVSAFKDNTNVLKFDSNPYSVTIAENSRLNDTVVNVRATTGISGGDSFSYQISSSSKNFPFRVSSGSGQITIAKSLDRETTSSYNFIVVANSASQTASANVLVGVTDVNDNAPVFSKINYVVRIPETTLPGASVFAVTATDADAGSNGRYSYNLVGGANGYFSLDTALGTISVSKALNSSHIGNFSVIISAADRGSPSLSSSSTVNIQVTVQRNKAPTFATSQYTFITAENVAGGSFIGTVIAHDSDPGAFGTITYRIVAGNSKNNFVVDSNTGAVRTAQQLDYETRTSFSLTVEAIDAGRPPKSAVTKVSIIVTDVNDNTPEFLGTPYAVSVSDQLPLGSSVLQVTATDKDSGTNGAILFAVKKGDSKGKFHIDVRSGTISLAASLDRTVQNSYILTIAAKDGGAPSLTGTAIVSVSVVPSSQLKPIFDQNVYAVSVLENSLSGTSVVKVRAREGSGSSGVPVIRYSVVGTTFFDVNAKSGVVSVSRLLDRETKAKYTVTVVATDQRKPPQSTTATIQIAISDVNDNSPAFSSQTYSVLVNEDSIIGQSVAIVQATDADYGSNAKITYEITQGNVGNAFSIDSATGSVTTASPLDREWTPKYVVRITATDQGSPRRRVSTILTVTIGDANDNAPHFSKPIYSANIDKNAAIGTSLLSATATDDDTGKNAAIKYKIASKFEIPFRIGSSTGLIVSSGVLMPKTYRFNIVAADEGVPSLNSTSDVVINVADINNHNPVFEKKFYEQTIHSSTLVGTVIVTVQAFDSDPKENGQVRYFLAENNETAYPFSVSPANGDITLTEAVENGQLFIFPVLAIDSGVKPRNATAQIIVKVNDETALGPSTGKTGLNIGIIVGTVVGGIAVVLLIIVIVVIAKRKSFSFKWRQDGGEVDSSVVFSADADNIAFTNPMYGDPHVTKQNPLYQGPDVTAKQNPIYSSTDDVLDRIQAELDFSLAKGFEDLDDAALADGEEE
eukprot:m.91691 g.91691  ORF g.91691 m.91691 type:complete len:1711 (+) comp36705_c0_seq1:99-5231(+)